MKKLIIILTVVFIIVTALTCTVSCTVLLINSGPSEGAEWTSPTTGMEFVWIEALDCWVGKYEVTNEEYREKEPDHDSKDGEGHSLNGDRQPVVFVNYSDAQQYAKWLTEKDREVLGGAEYRLPTRDEWMTFAQCGDGREYPWGDNWPPPSGRAGNYSGQESAWWKNKIDGYRDGHPVTCDVEKSWENPWGLYGVGGNVWECTSKSSGGDFDAWRGASWGPYSRGALRCSYRLDDGASIRSRDGGFRLLLAEP
ncbi:MAG: SUMF1/EgtB/PvdO family nonheme iron enzyme [Lentisphaeria bacterium]